MEIQDLEASLLLLEQEARNFDEQQSSESETDSSHHSSHSTEQHSDLKLEAKELQNLLPTTTSSGQKDISRLPQHISTNSTTMRYNLADKNHVTIEVRTISSDIIKHFTKD